MEAVTDPEEFRAAPLGKYFVGPSFAVWCYDQTLCGNFVWGRPNEREARALVRMFDIEHALAPRFAAITDASRMELVAPPVFLIVADYLRRRFPELAPRMHRLALVVPPGLFGSALVGLIPLLGVDLPWRLTKSVDDSLAWIGTRSARSAAGELEALAQKACGKPSLLYHLHEYLRAHLADASIENAAAHLALSRRTLQRSLTQSKTAFREELETVRMDEAVRRLIETDDKLEVIAAELGFGSPSHFASAFRTSKNTTPSQFRALHRKPAE